MTDWVRLWHDMPTDPKWRVIARRSGASIAEVIAVFNFMMVNASANATERGRTHNLFAEDIAAALDVDDTVVEAIFAVMEGKVVSDGVLMGWDKRQPKREDNSASRAKKWRDDKKAERERTQPNANERPEKETETDNSEAKASVAAASAIDVAKVIFDTGVEILMATGRSNAQSRDLIGKWRKAYSDSIVMTCLSRCQVERPSDPIGWMTKSMQAERSKANGQPAATKQPTTLDAGRRAIDLTGGSDGGDAPDAGTGNWGTDPLPDAMRTLGYVTG